MRQGVGVGEISVTPRPPPTPRSQPSGPMPVKNRNHKRCLGSELACAGDHVDVPGPHVHSRRATLHIFVCLRHTS